jgi:hypothetical protein
MFNQSRLAALVALSLSTAYAPAAMANDQATFQYKIPCELLLAAANPLICTDTITSGLLGYTLLSSGNSYQVGTGTQLFWQQGVYYPQRVQTVEHIEETVEGLVATALLNQCSGATLTLHDVTYNSATHGIVGTYDIGGSSCSGAGGGAGTGGAGGMTSGGGLPGMR